MKKTITSAMAILTLAACKNNKDATVETPEPIVRTYMELEKAEWLLGRWENNSKEGNLSEVWKKENDSLYKGGAYFIIGKDTVFRESVDLLQRDGKLFYIVSIEGQNNEKPVEFEMKSANDKQIAFENPAHDYPTKIIYNKIADDSIVAEISGKKDGRPASETFAMKKTQ
jgi:hypothetical protein